jgi:DNA-binding transcriptional ArsR family regulator
MLYNERMDKFHALADPTRRKIIEALASQGQLSATQIAGQFPISPQAISQHLKVLRETRWVQVEKRAQQRIYHINPEATGELEDWAHQLRMLWSQRFDALEQVIEAEKGRLEGDAHDQTG